MSEDPRSEEVERLLSMQRAAQEVTRSAADWWKHLSDVASTVISGETLEALYRESLPAIQRVLEADEVSVLLANESEQALIARTSIGLGEEGSVELLIPAGEGMAGRVLASRRPLIVGDLSQIPLVSPVLRQRGHRSVVAVPIISQKRILGVLHAGSQQLDHFTDSDAQLLAMIAERLSIAMERVELFEEQRRLAQVASFLAETARIMSGGSDLHETLDGLARAALPVLGDICLIDTVDDGSLKRIIARHVDPSKQEITDRLRRDFSPDLNGQHPAAAVLQMGGSRWAPTMSDDFLRSTTLNDEHYSLTKELGFRSYLVVPISSELRPIGALTVVSCSRSLTEEDVKLAEGLAQQVSSVVAKAQQLDGAMRVSHEFQAALLPEFLPDIAGLTIYASYRAQAASLDVGGDFFDALALPNGRAWLMVGDVEGHDQRAAAIMGQMRSAARTLACEGHSPAGVIGGLRTCWRYFGFNRMATGVVVEIEPGTGLVTMASAGHPPPLLVSDTDCELLSVEPSPLLGIDGTAAKELPWTLLPGHVLVLYTDGALSERKHGIDEGLERLCKACQGAEPQPQAICERIVGLDPEREDDVALLCVARRLMDRGLG